MSAPVSLYEGLGALTDPDSLKGSEKPAQRRARDVPGITRITGVKRDCTCPRARHKHGTRDAYQSDKCSCGPCRVAWSKYQKRWKYRQSKGETLTPAGPHILKLRCLAALGYSQRMLGNEMGIARESMRDLFTTEHILPRTARLIDKTYRRLFMKVPPATTRESRQARARARKLGWLTPLAYNEDWTLVQPERHDHPARSGPNTDWRGELEFLVSCGESEEQALKQLGRSKGALNKQKERAAA